MRGGGDVSGTEAVLVAGLGGSDADALGAVTGIESKTVIDATNLVGATPPDGFASNSEYIKSRTAGPTAKSFNINFAALHHRLGEARARPGNLWCGDEAAREVVEWLSRAPGTTRFTPGAWRTRPRRASSSRSSQSPRAGWGCSCNG